MASLGAIHLKGLNGVLLAVEELDEEMKKDGIVTRKEIAKKFEVILSKRGLKVFDVRQ